MFSLTDSLRYWLYSEPCDMRKSFYTLSGLVTNTMKRDPLSGDVFIFINKSQTRMKILRMEPGGLVIYAKMLDIGRFHRPEPNLEGIIEWSDLVMMVEGIIDSKERRLRRLKNASRGQ
ncbi:MAG: IS66 family insertion sequence element accessory protein TnpB [Rikenellaceae bacterium]